MNPPCEPACRGTWPPVIAIVGPTAVGKSALALEVAERLNAEIISADSRQVYRYMDIGTAKPTRVEQSRVKHYMIDLVTPLDPYSAQRFREEGTTVLRRLHNLDRVAVIVGGTGFYLRALLDRPEFGHAVPDPALRETLRRRADVEGPEALHAQLKGLDPASAARIHANNIPRVIRALEIVLSTGQPVPESRSRLTIPALWLGLESDRDALDARADQRVLQQVDDGLIEETRLLLAIGYHAGLPAMQGFGYRQMVAYLAGDLSLDEAIAQYQLATRQYIRRQRTWFRADRRIRWLENDGMAAEAAFSIACRWLTEGRRE